MATEIKAYKTQDGKIFTDAREAEQHDSAISIKSSVLDLMSQGSWADVRDDAQEEVADFIVEFKDELLDLLQEHAENE